MSSQLLLRLLLASTVAAAAPSTHNLHRRTAGCGAAPPIALGERTNATLSNNRTYMYWLPPSYDASTPTPVILSFHGADLSPDWQADLDELTDPLFNTDHIMVYPSATAFANGNVTNRFWHGAPGAEAADDVGYVLAVLDQLESALCVDTARVYATGKSQGGMMTNNLACDAAASARFAAFAPVAGSYYCAATAAGSCEPDDVPIPCSPGRSAIPLLAFHGGNDTTIAYAGGERKGACLPSIEHWVDEWVARDGLPAEPAVTTAPPGGSGEDDDDDENAKVYSYGTGELEGLVTFVYAGDRVNHDWPSTVDNGDTLLYGSPPAEFNASAMIMEFFAQYTLP